MAGTLLNTPPWDIAVVGAGPAGATAAFLLARAGAKVMLLDKCTFPRRKVCGCCLNEHALSALKEAGLGEVPTRLRAISLSQVRLAAAGRTANIRLTGGVALSREALDTELVRLAATVGAEVRTGMKVKLARHDAHGWELLAGDEVVSTKLVIDATGLNGRLTGTDTAVSANSRIGGGVVLASQPEYRAGVIHMATGGGGYVGLVRVEDSRLDVAAAFDSDFVIKAGGLGAAAELVVREAGLPPLTGLTNAEWKGTPPLTRTPRVVAGQRWFAVGDATGYVEPFTGEGMAWALAGAIALVPVVVNALGGWDQRHARVWTSTHHKVVTRRQSVCRLAARLLRSPVLCSLTVRALSMLPGVAAPVVRVLNRPLHRVR